jgi:putative oxidoreductase
MSANETLTQTIDHVVSRAPVSVVKLTWYETAARYVLALIYAFGAVDGALFLFADIYLHGKPSARVVPFLVALQHTTYFWAFMKLIQFVGALSLFANYKPALGLALLIPVSSVLCLFYIFELPSFIPFGSIVAMTTIILCRAYWKSYAHLLDDYSW